MTQLEISLIRDNLLHNNEYKIELEKLAYANGVLDMFCETRKLLNIELKDLCLKP